MANNVSQYWFAWASSTETTFDESHQREDELIFSFKLTHEEGQFATLDLEIRNPHIGLLAPGRPFWAWFSWSDGTTVTPLFFGRLVGIPSDLFADVVTLNFIAKPKDYVEQRLALADSLKIFPFYDPIFIDEKSRDDPDTVLEGYSALWHVDRTSHVVTISDVIAGDSVEEFTPNDVFYDNVSLEIAEAPLLVCEIDASVNWVQADNTGVIELGKQNFSSSSSAVGDDLPKVGEKLGPGLSAKKIMNDRSLAITGRDLAGNVNISWDYRNEEETHSDNDVMSASGHYTVNGQWGSTSPDAMPGQIIDYLQTMVIGDAYTGTAAEASISIKSQATITQHQKQFPTPTDMEIGVEVEQDRQETIHVRVLADVQPIMTEASEEENSIKETLSMSAEDVVKAGAASASAGVYFPTARGLQSLEYLLMVARAHLLVRSRVVKVSWDCRFARILDMSCRKNASIEDARLPGGSVLGKIVAYEMSGTGDTGEFLGNVTINSAIGYGNEMITADGTPDYVEVGYVDPGYQHYSGTLLAAVTNDMSFAPLAYVSEGIQLPISANQVLVRHEWNDAFQAEAVERAVEASAMAVRQLNNRQITVPPPSSASGGPPSEVLQLASAQAAMIANVNQAIRDNPAWLEIELKPVQGISTEVEYNAEISPLVIPMQIDLSAASTP